MIAPTYTPPTLTRVFYTLSGTEGSFFLPKGADPYDYISYPVTRTESATFTQLQLVSEIVAHLPGEWTPKPISKESPDSQFYIDRSDGLRLFLRLTECYGSKGKGSAQYSRPRGARNERIELWDSSTQTQDPQIGFALTKTPEQIARDIANRLLPDAEAVHARVLERVAASHAYADKAAYAKRVAEQHAALFRSFGLDLRVSEGSVECRCYLDAEQIKAIAARLGGAK
jgi:hypothetical protein